MSHRLALVPLAPEHLDLEAKLDFDAEVMRCIGGPAQSMAEVERAHRRRMDMARKVEGLGFWTAFASAGSGGDVGETAVVELGEFVGLLMFPPAHGPDQPDDPRFADLGYRLTPSAWGRGYAREAVAMLLDHGFTSVGLERVVAQTRVDNARSRRLLEAAGLRYVRTFRSLADESHRPRDVEYQIARADWISDRDSR